jgi:hypothetical protein
MSTTNRVHTFTRWPADPFMRLELSMLDGQFVFAMRKIVGDCEELRKIERIAFCMGRDAEDEILQVKQRKPK